MKLPAETQCYRIMAGMAMLDNIVAHSIRVCQVATLLTDSLNAAGHNLDRKLIRVAALLHDITKTRSLKTTENHARSGADYLRELGYPELGDIVGQHVKLSVFDPAGKPNAAEVLNYADKRVLHDNVVSLEERMAYIMKRYHCSGELGNYRLEIMLQATQAIETKLFAKLPFVASELDNHLVPEDFESILADFQKTVPDYSNPPAW
ncbi:MAG: HDIG domain-containing protein [Desulfobacterales bacterium]|nr:HDIG domain-containing protein [Desulfobacterales bacterium]